MRKLALFVGLVAVLASSGPARAVIGATDDVPAATVLLPYFEVDPNGTSARGVTTLLTINNASASATLNHLTVWSDLAVPVMAFDFYQTGFDVTSMDLQAVLGGQLPLTASAGQDPMDALSPHGPISQDINFASCTGQLPPPPGLTADFVAHIRASLTGQFSSLLGGCAGRNFGDGIMRGYITVDVVNACSLLFPGDPGYFLNGFGVAGNRNIIWGDYQQIDKATHKVYGDALVHIEADAMNPQTNTAGQYTFYGRLVGFNATDNREPLATTFASRFFNASGVGFPQRTSLVVWRDPKTPQSAFACGSANPPWFPLSQEQIVVFDEEEDPEESPSSPVAPPPPGTVLIPFPGATQRVRVGGADLPAGFDRGWLYLDLNTTVTTAATNPPEDPTAAQAWVTVIQENADTGAYGVRGQTSVGYRALALDNATVPTHLILPVP
jgi:hypothetical protein